MEAARKGGRPQDLLVASPTVLAVVYFNFIKLNRIEESSFFFLSFGPRIMTSPFVLHGQAGPCYVLRCCNTRPRRHHGPYTQRWVCLILLLPAMPIAVDDFKSLPVLLVQLASFGGDTKCVFSGRVNWQGSIDLGVPGHGVVKGLSSLSRDW